jgi:hypothetical protein
MLLLLLLLCCPALLQMPSTAIQAAAKLASGLVSTVWHVVDDMVVAPALQDYVAANGTPGRDADAAAQAARAPTRVLGHSVARN